MSALKPVKRLLRRVRAELYARRYGKLLKRLRSRVLRDPSYRVRVAFLVNDNTKWNCQSVYDRMAEHPRFEPYIVVCKQDQTELEEKTRSGYDDDLDFFKSRGIPFIEGYDRERTTHRELRDFKFDIVFFIQPWGFAEGIQDLHTVARYALSCSVPYSLPICNDESDYNLSFHNTVWRVFLPSDLSLAIAHRLMDNGGANCVVSGYPKLDAYERVRRLVHDESGKKTILYAPHHSFKNRLRFATFQWNGLALLEYAKDHPETQWVFKPHPRLKYELVACGIMTESEANAYYEAWARLPNGSLYLEGDYIKLFVRSDALITDCVSFLGEYLPSGKPVILPVNTESIGYNEFGESIVSAYYKAYTIQELLDMIERVVLRGDDVMQESRRAAAEMLVESRSTAERVVLNLLHELGA